MNRLLFVTLFLSSTALALALPAPGRAQAVKWDQDRVTELADQLADVVVELQIAFRREPASPGHLQGRARHGFRDSLRVLRTETRAFASELEAGAGLEETWPIVRRARVVIRDLREDGRRMAWQEPAVGHARRAEELIAQIAPFYAGAEAEDKSGAEAGGAGGDR
jgi:hypothetical protein